MKEQRFFKVELRRDENGRPHAFGLAARYNVLSHELGGFRERIKPGAFRSAIKRQDDIFCLVSHDANRILGRSSSGTLQLRDTDDGLAFDCELPDTQEGNDTATLLERQDLRECSFGFICDKADQAWDDEDYEDERGMKCRGTVRSISNFSRIVDVSIVPTPAYPATSVAVRSLFPEGIPSSVAEHVVVPEIQNIGGTSRRDLLRRILS